MTRPKTTAHPCEVMRGEKYKTVNNAIIENIVKKIVALVAKEKAAPGFRTRVN
jgi:hypothetical protein